MFSNIHYNYRKNTITLWEYNKEGIREQITEDYQPYAFVYDKSGKYKDLYGVPCKRKEFNDLFSQKEYVKNYDTLEGDISPECRYIVDKYYDKDLIDVLPKLDIHIIDIETYASAGFPIATDPKCEIFLITVYSTKTGKFTSFGREKYDGKLPINYIHCSSEEELIKNYFKFHRSDFPDIITGWNSRYFDIVYIIERASFLLGENYISKYSPVNDVKIKNYNDNKFVSIGGITQLDYMDLYKEYSPEEQESYSLNYISQEELGEKKYDYSEYGNLDDLRIKNWYKYVEYNIRDVYLVKKLHDKFDFISLVQGQAYLTKVPFDKVEFATRKVDGYLLSILKPLKIVLPTAKRNNEGVIPGGYVKEVKRGYYKYAITYDYTGLYPSNIFALNISPETYYGKIELTTGHKQMVQADNLEWYTFLDIENLIDEDYYNVVPSNGLVGLHINGIDLKKLIIKEKLNISANGLLFRSGWGFIPRVVKGLFDKRKEFKNMMIDEEKLFEETKDKKHDYSSKKYKALQESLKVLCNSVYGVLLQKGFRLYNIDFGMAITLTGQKINKFTTDKFNDLFSKKFGVNEVVIASDTDGFILDVESYIKKYNISDDNFLKAYIYFHEHVIKPETVKWTEEFSRLLNVEKNWYNLKLEVISNGTILVKKKKYAMQMIYKEGVKYTKPKMKIMGMEIIRTSTPSFCRKKIEETIIDIINGVDKKIVRENLIKIREEFNKCDVQNVSYPRSLNGLDKYDDGKGSYKPKCPIQVRAAINYNKLVRKLGLENKYSIMRNGDKIKFIYVIPNSKHSENIIGYLDELPKEFNLTNNIDYDIQFEKSFMSPIQTISKAIGWGMIDLNQDSLDSFF